MDYDFNQQMQMADSMDTPVRLYLQSFGGPYSTVTRACAADDKAGTDYWVNTSDTAHVSVDVKIRTQDWAAKTTDSKDDLALETWSVLYQRIGWTLDPAKQTDYVLWHWIDSGRFCMLPFQQLRAVFGQHRDRWVTEYGTAKQTSARGGMTWLSEICYVPRKTVIMAMADMFYGKPGTTTVQGGPIGSVTGA